MKPTRLPTLSGKERLVLELLVGDGAKVRVAARRGLAWRAQTRHRLRHAGPDGGEGSRRIAAGTRVTARRCADPADVPRHRTRAPRARRVDDNRAHLLDGASTMSTDNRLKGEWSLRIARRLLDANAITRVIEPAIEDLRHEAVAARGAMRSLLVARAATGDCGRPSFSAPRLRPSPSRGRHSMGSRFG